MIRLKINIMEGTMSWTVDESKQEGWYGIPSDGRRIKGLGVGVTADMPIVFSGTGKIEIQQDIYKIGYIDEYLGSEQIELSIR